MSERPRRTFYQSGDRHYSKRTPEKVKRGTNAPGAKLRPADILRLYQYADGGWRPHELASHFRVSRQTIWRHLRRRTTQ